MTATHTPGAGTQARRRRSTLIALAHPTVAEREARGTALRAQVAINARLCGRTLAKAHARSGDSVEIAAYLGGGDRFDEALASFAETYADQNERDHGALEDAIASGRVRAETGL